MTAVHTLPTSVDRVNSARYATSPLASRFLRWCTYRIEQDPGRDKPTKRPYDPRTGRRAKPNDPATFTDLTTAVGHCDTYDGVGLLVEGGSTFVDLDDLLAPENAFKADTLPVWARELAAQTYTEWSPSGTGIHLFYAATVDGYPNKRKSILHAGVTVEQYSARRFATVTFHPVPGTVETFNDDPAVLIRALDCAGMPTLAYEAAQQRSAPASVIQVSPATTIRTPVAGLDNLRVAGELEDDEVIAKAFRSKVGDRIRALWDGDASGYPSDSEADLALMRYLWFYTGDNWDQLARLWRSSGLTQGREDKANRDDYVERSFDKLRATPLTVFWSEGYRTGITAPVHFNVGPTPEPPNLDVDPGDTPDTVVAKVDQYRIALDAYREQLAARDRLIVTESRARRILANPELSTVRLTAYALVVDLALRIEAGERPRDRRYRISSQRLAEATGTKRKTINSHLNRLKKDGLIDKDEPLQETVVESIDYETGELVTDTMLYKVSYITLPEGGLEELIDTLCAGATETRHGGKRQPRICKHHPYETTIEIRTTYHCPACVAEGRESELQHEYHYMERDPEDHARQIAQERLSDPAFDRRMEREDRLATLEDDERFPGVKINPSRRCLSCDVPVPLSRKLCHRCEEEFVERDRKQAKSWQRLREMMNVGTADA